jgi:hypothetical protein
LEFGVLKSLTILSKVFITNPGKCIIEIKITEGSG